MLFARADVDIILWVQFGKDVNAKGPLWWNILCRKYYSDKSKCAGSVGNRSDHIMWVLHSDQLFWNFAFWNLSSDPLDSHHFFCAYYLRSRQKKIHSLDADSWWSLGDRRQVICLQLICHLHPCAQDVRISPHFLMRSGPLRIDRTSCQTRYGCSDLLCFVPIFVPFVTTDLDSYCRNFWTRRGQPMGNPRCNNSEFFPRNEPFFMNHSANQCIH